MTKALIDPRHLYPGYPRLVVPPKGRLQFDRTFATVIIYFQTAISLSHWLWIRLSFVADHLDKVINKVK